MPEGTRLPSQDHRIRRALLRAVSKVALFLPNSGLIKGSMCEMRIEGMFEARDTYLIATKDRTRLKLVAEFINAGIE